MHKSEFWMNFYTDGRNTNLADAIIKSTYKTALRSPDKTHTLGIHDNGTAYMDDTKVITNADLIHGNTDAFPSLLILNAVLLLT